MRNVPPSPRVSNAAAQPPVLEGVRKAEKELTLRTDLGVDVLVELNRQIFERQGLPAPYDAQLLRLLWRGEERPTTRSGLTTDRVVAAGVALAAFRPALASLLAQLGARLLEFSPGHIAVAVEVQPVEGKTRTLLATLVARLASFFGGEAAVAIQVETVETLRGPFDDLLAIDVPAAIPSRSVSGLGDNRTRNNQQAEARQDAIFLHDELRSRFKNSLAGCR